MTCTSVAETNPTIVLRRNWFYLIQRIWFELGEGEVALGRVIIVGGHDFEPSTKPRKSYPVIRDVNWSSHME